jgi:UDPglucose 6-dehydrogenase
VLAHDPAATERAQQVLPASAQLRYVADPFEAAEGADALLILTDWPQFAQLDLPRLHKTLRYPIVIDGRNLYHPAAMLQHGLMYLSVGRPASYPTRDVAALNKP